MTALDLDAIEKQHALDLELGRWSDSTEPLLAEVKRLQARIDAALALCDYGEDGISVVTYADLRAALTGGAE